MLGSTRQRGQRSCRWLALQVLCMLLILLISNGTQATAQGVGSDCSSAGVTNSGCTGWCDVAGGELCADCDSNATGCAGTSPGTCNAGYSSTDSGVTCTACGSGFYKPSAGNVACTACDANGCNGQDRRASCRERV